MFALFFAHVLLAVCSALEFKHAMHSLGFRLNQVRFCFHFLLRSVTFRSLFMIILQTQLDNLVHYVDADGSGSSFFAFPPCVFREVFVVFRASFVRLS